MNYYRQVLTVTLWEYKRFYKIKNELIGIVVMLMLFAFGFFGGKYVAGGMAGKSEIMVMEGNETLEAILSQSFDVKTVEAGEEKSILEEIAQEKEGMLLLQTPDGFALHAYKKPRRFARLQEKLDEYSQHSAREEKGLSVEDFMYVTQAANVVTHYQYLPGKGKRPMAAYFFAGFMVMAVFISFAYQFTGITGEKQLKITEQIVSAIKPQVWMDGKILGITLTGLSSLVVYSILSVLGGMLFFMFTDVPVMQIGEYLHAPSLLLYLVFTLMGVLMWNALLAGIASVITDPNNSGKGSLMLLPVLFVLTSLIVLTDPDSYVAVFLSWFPLTSATALPMRWISTDLAWWNIPGSFILLVLAFYLLRKLAAKIFRVSILISGKEPSWAEVYKMIKEK